MGDLHLYNNIIYDKTNATIIFLCLLERSESKKINKIISKTMNQNSTNKFLFIDVETKCNYSNSVIFNISVNKNKNLILEIITFD
jgi:hypothetical protein